MFQIKSRLLFLSIVASFLPQSSCQALFIPQGNYSSVPKQLNQSSFARCMSVTDGGLPDLVRSQDEHNFDVGDGLLLYLSLYAGQRFPIINESLQQPAFERWSVSQGDQELLVANCLSTMISLQTGSQTSPGFLFHTAVDACNSVATLNGENTWPGQGDVFCAVLTSHNVLRALGRRSTYIDEMTGVDYAPQWLKDNETYWVDTFAPVMQASMLPLRNDGGGDGWGEWYHTFGLLTFGIQQSALFGVEVGGVLDYGVAVADTIVAALVTPDHKPEDPVKARVDRDVARLLTRFLNQNYTTIGDDVCELEAGYVLPVAE